MQKGRGRGGYYFDREKKHSEVTETSCQPVSKKTDQTRKKLQRKWYCFGLSCSNFIEDGQWIFQKWRLVKATDPFSIVIVKLVRRFLFNWLMLLETGVTFHQIGGVVLLLEVTKEKIMLRIGAVIESWNFFNQLILKKAILTVLKDFYKENKRRQYNWCNIYSQVAASQTP